MAQLTGRGLRQSGLCIIEGFWSGKWGQAHLPATHVSQTKPRNCPSTSAGGQRSEGWKGGDARVGQEGTRGESERMLIWQLQNCPRTDGKHASEEERENENERKSDDTYS